VRFETGGAGGDAHAARTAQLHWLGAQDGLKGQRTAREELAFWTRWSGGRDAAVDGALETVGLADRAGLETRRLSSGQRRRLALARLLAAPRSLWLLDEPLAPLDASWRSRMGELMAAHLAGGGLIVAAVHDPLPVPARNLTLGEAS
jgi:heme exporter protein A